MSSRLGWQDYDTAKLLKEAETQLKSLGRELAQLEAAKREAVEDEDYDRAKMIKVRGAVWEQGMRSLLTECRVIRCLVFHRATRVSHET